MSLTQAPRERTPYDSPEYQRLRRKLLAGSPLCWVPGCEELATVADHQPPLLLHDHLGDGRGCCYLMPSCSHHSAQQGWRLRHGLPVPSPEDGPLAEVQEPAGFPEDHPIWEVPWLEALLPVPLNATWPRLMTPPHPRAVDSLGPRFIAWAEERSGKPLRWWQRLVSVRLLEVDALGHLVWDALILTMARQLGKSWLLRELMFWRIHQAERFQEEQTVLHTGKDLAICKEVQRPVRLWAKRSGSYHVRESNGQEEIEHCQSGSRWLVRARTAVYGVSANLAVVDEAWKVEAEVVDDGVTPTMVERAQPQLLLVSTAHRKATSLMLNRRRSALSALDHPEQGGLLVEWSTPRGMEVDNGEGWRLASPHWTEQRERIVADQLQRALSGEVDDIEEPDPMESFRSQWLNQWPVSLVRDDKGEPWVDSKVWAGAATTMDGEGPAVLAMEDWYGQGAAVAIAREVANGATIVAGWEYPRRYLAYRHLAELATMLPDSTLVIGATLATEPEVAELPVNQVVLATGSRTRTGLALFREALEAGALVYDPADGEQLSAQVQATRVMRLASGLTLVAGGRQDLVRAAVWALSVLAEAEPVAAIH